MIFFPFRIVEKGFYSEQDAALCVKQLCEAVGVRLIANIKVQLNLIAFSLSNVLF